MFFEGNDFWMTRGAEWKWKEHLCLDSWTSIPWGSMSKQEHLEVLAQKGLWRSWGSIMTWSWSVSFPSTPPHPWEVINFSTRPFYSPQIKAPIGGPVGMTLLKCLTRFLDCFVSHSLHPSYQTHLISRDLSACPAWGLHFLRLEAPWVNRHIWGPQTKDISYSSWCVAFHFIHSTNIDPSYVPLTVQGSYFSMGRGLGWWWEGRLAILTAYQFSLWCKMSAFHHYDVKCQCSIKPWVSVWLNTELLFKPIFTLFHRCFFCLYFKAILSRKSPWGGLFMINSFIKKCIHCNVPLLVTHFQEAAQAHWNACGRMETQQRGGLALRKDCGNWEGEQETQ